MNPVEPFRTSFFRTSRIELWGGALTGAEWSPPELPGEATIGRIVGDDSASASLRAGLAAAMQPTPRAEVERRLAAGSRAYVVRVGTAVVSYAWVSFAEEEIGELEGSIRVGPGEAYIWDCATLPAWRGRGLYPALLRAVARDLAAEGRSWVWIAAAADNAPSLRGFVKTGGLQRIAVVRYLRIGSWRRLAVVGDADAPPPRVAAAKRALAP